ncbi:hypothetical protein AA21291_2070 [Swaminathania salitolerans LMG 21291]|uniref:Uncharacterized protein n=2 Tax=Swaminathania salitolerans TaxID=182838 RepID=A0A511BPJ2_9PROT|nr:hypothetical protein AA21291_2070 [Swaminathania salitolerans LMG 21291]GEL02002.1 hypothetical protein SSA02_11650 [Swaminathania salitolerans]
MKTTWHDHDTSLTVRKNEYITLGGSSQLGSANDIGTMIISPDKELAGIGLLLNNEDRTDQVIPLNHVTSNFVFIFNFRDEPVNHQITINEMQAILDLINDNSSGFYYFRNEYFIKSSFD